MRITVHLTRYRPEHITSVNVMDLPDDATIHDLITKLPSEFYTRIETERYYRIRNSSFGFDSFFAIQFVISNGKIIWMPSYEETRLRDFFETNQITDNEIYMTTGISGRGGGPSEIISHWQVILDALSAISSIYTLKNTPRAFLKRIRLRKRHTEIVLGPVADRPGQFFSLVLSRDKWNATDLADICGLTIDQAKNALRLCGYIYDRRRQMYIATDKTSKVADTLNKLTFPQSS